MTTKDAVGNLHADSGRFTNKSQTEDDIALPTPTRLQEYGSIQAAWYTESGWAGTREYASLTGKQKKSVRQFMDELDEHVGEPAQSRRYEVHENACGLVVYGWSKYKLLDYQTWAVRLELTPDGDPLEPHVAYFDQYGPIWTHRDETFASGS